MKPDHPRLRSRLGRLSRRTVVGVVAGLSVLSMVVAAIGWGVATARDDDLAGRTVSDEHLTTIRAAARSCPTLTPARLAGQLMAESGLNGRKAETTSGGRGIAGLDDDAWQAWAPWPGAQRSDAAANIIALAHHMCDLSGQVRLAKVSGDAWRLSLAAFHSGLDRVRDARGVPSGAARYVDRASGYAAYYGKLVPFGGPDRIQPSGDRPQPKPIPADYIPLLVRAGSVCAQVPPAAVAAQVMTLSGFDLSMLGPEGQRGVAQFRPEVWRDYGPAGLSVWDPQVAIPTVGTAMCALLGELSGLGGDPYLLALAAYRNGPAAVRQTGGALDGPTEAFLRTVRQNTESYALDGRLKPPPPKSPQPGPTPTKPVPPPATSTATAPPPRPKTPAPTRPLGRKQIVGKPSGLCVSAGPGNGAPVTLRACQEDPSQWWDFRADGTIRANGFCLGLAGRATAEGTPVRMTTCSDDALQKWRWTEYLGIQSLINPAASRCLDVVRNLPGASLKIWTCIFNPGQTFSVR